MASRIQGITVEIGGDTTKLSKALEGVNKSIKGTQSGLKDVNKLLKLDPSNTELVVQKQKMLKDAIEATKEKLATLKTAAQQANEQLANGEITQQQYDALQREIAETEQNLKSLQEQAATTNATLAKIDEAGEKLQNLGSSVENVGKKFLPVTAAVTGLGTAAVKTAADFDAEMSKVSAISGATGADFDKLRAKAREMGAKTKFSATEAASAMEYMAMAGWRTEDMLSGIEGIMNLAAASGEDLATTSDIVTDALTAFGLSASDSGHFADILAAASSNANTNVSMMGETFKYCAPIAGALGFSAEDTAEAIGLMANSGIKASQAGTSLRSIMNNLAGDVTFVGKNIGEVTIATSNADGSMRSLNDILADCRVAFAGLSESEKAANAEALVGKNAMSGFLALMNAGEGDINKLRGAIEGCDGASERMAETMQDNLSGQLTILKSQLEELAISFADILMPTIRKIVSAVQQFVDKLNSMDDSTREVIIRVALLAAAIGPLLIVLGKTISTVGTAMRGFSSLAKGVRLLITHVGGASGAFGKLGAVLGGLSGPVVAVVAVIGTLVAAFLDLWNTNEEFRTAITGIWNDIVSKVKAFCDQLTQRINALGFDFKDKLKNKLTKNVCICGDSLVDNGHVATEVYRLLAEDGDCVIHQLGTRGPDGGKHEGRGSWTFARYLADSDYAGKTNAFWDKLKSRLDFQKYCETNGYEGIDYFLIALGTNDVSQGSTLYRTEAEVQKFVDQAKQFIDALLDKETGFPNCKVGIGLCGPGSDYSYQCGASMGIFHMSINTLNLALIKAFDAGKYHKNVTCFAEADRTARLHGKLLGRAGERL